MLPVVNVPSRGPLLIVSPHFDDAVLSCWALLDRPDGPTDVVTVCGGIPADGLSNWDRQCGFHSGGEAATARREEDRRALAGHARTVWSLPVLDAAYGEVDRRARGAVIAEAVGDWIAANRDAARTTGLRIAVPAGAGAGAGTGSSGGPRGRGGPALEWLRWLKHQVHLVRRRRAQFTGFPPHPDHLQTRDLVLEALHLATPGDGGPRPAIEVLLYEELPYLWWGTADDAARRAAARFAVEPRPTSLPVDRDHKSAALAHYTSQLPMLDPLGRLGSPGTLPDHERYWSWSIPFLTH